MSLTVFSIAFSIMIAGMIAFLILNFRTLPVVKAGKVTKLCPKNVRVLGYMPRTIKVNGTKIDVSRDEKMLVRGNSMKDFNICDGQRIYVRILSVEEKKTITRYPVLVFNIVDNPNKDDAEYKLRKFVGYVTSNRWSEIYDKFNDRIKISEQAFTRQCASKYSRLSSSEQCDLVLSETFNEDKHEVCYSLHPISTVYGKVEYAL